MSTSRRSATCAHAVVEHGVARDPQRAVLLALPAQREADHVADDRVAERRPVAARRRGDLDRRPPGRLEPRGLPTASSPRAPPPSRAAPGRGGHHDARPTGSSARPGGVEVVAVVVVGEQDGVDRRRGRRRRSPARPACATPCPSRSGTCRPGGSNVGSVSSRQPPTSISTVGPPMWVMRTSLHAPARPRRRGSTRPVERVVGDLLPARPARAAGAGPRTP